MRTSSNAGNFANDFDFLDFAPVNTFIDWIYSLPVLTTVPLKGVKRSSVTYFWKKSNSILKIHRENEALQYEVNLSLHRLGFPKLAP